MFCLWALYIRSGEHNQPIDIDHQTEIAYQWQSPYYTGKHSNSWDFTVPRTPHNEAILLNRTTNGELIPFNTAEHSAYFIGLPWLTQSEIDSGILRLVQVSPSRFTLQFTQVNHLLERLKHATGFQLRITPSSTDDFKGSTPKFFIAQGESTRARTTSAAYCVAIRIDVLLQEILAFGAQAKKNIHIQHYLTTKPNLYLLSSRTNLLGSVQRVTTPEQTIYTAGTVIELIDKKIKRHEVGDYYSPTLYLTSADSFNFPTEGNLYQLLQEICGILQCGIRFQETLTGNFTCTITSPQTTRDIYPRLGELVSFEFTKFEIHTPPPYDKVCTKEERDIILKLKRPIPYNAPLPLVFYTKEDKDKNPEDKPQLGLRYFARGTLFHFLNLVADGADFYQEHPTTLTRYNSRNIPTYKHIGNNPYSAFEYKSKGRYAKPVNDTLRITIYNDGRTNIDNIRILDYVEAFGEIYYHDTDKTQWHYLGTIVAPEQAPKYRDGISTEQTTLLRGHLIFAPPEPLTDLTLTTDSFYLYTEQKHFETPKPFQSIGQPNQDLPSEFIRYIDGKKYYFYTEEDYLIWRVPDSPQALHHQLWLLAYRRDYEQLLGNRTRTIQGSIERIVISDGFNPKPPFKPILEHYYATPNPDAVIYNRDGLPSRPPRLGDDDLIPVPPTPKPPTPNPDPGLPGNPTVWQSPVREDLDEVPTSVSSRWEELYDGKITIPINTSPPIPTLNIPLPNSTEALKPKIYLRSLCGAPYLAQHPHLEGKFSIKNPTQILTLAQQPDTEINYYQQLLIRLLYNAIEGTLSVHREDVIFNALHRYPYPDTSSEQQIAQQRIKSLNLTLRRQEITIRSATVIQFNATYKP